MGARVARSEPAQTPGLAGQCSLARKREWPLDWGIQDLGTGRIQAPHQHRSALEAQSLDAAEEAVSCEALPPRPSISSRRSEIGGAEGSLPTVMSIPTATGGRSVRAFRGLLPMPIFAFYSSIHSVPN